MISLPTTFAPNTKTLKSGQLSPLGQTALDALQEKGYAIELGLTEDLATSIQDMALQPSIQEYCPNDSTDRFKDMATTEHWLSKGRTVFLLCRQTGTGTQELAGYGWVGAKTSPLVPDGQTTFGLRIGEADQGKGLATPYTRAMLDAAIRLFDFKHLWLEAWTSNAGAVHVYQKLGFTEVAHKADRRQRPDGTYVPDTRLYMHLDSILV